MDSLLLVVGVCDVGKLLGRNCSNEESDDEFVVFHLK